MIARQTVERRHQFSLGIIQLLKLRLHRPLGVRKNFHLAPGSPVIPPNKIERSRSNCSVKQGAIFDAEIASPEADESILHHILGVRCTSDPLPGEQDQTRCQFRKTDFPIFMSGDILHDPSRSLLLRRRQPLNLFIAGKVFFVAALCTISLSALAQSADTLAAREIARIDREYSNLSVVKGMPAASVEHFAEDGVAFAPTAVNGKKYWASQTDFPGTLIWQPIFAFVSAAGELGYTTGVWELKKENEPSLGFGHYVTIWVKQRDGKWKIALDVGTENPQPREPPPNLQILPPEITRQPRDDAHRNLRNAGFKLTGAARNDIGKAIIDSATDAIRIYRDKTFPAVGLVAVKLMLCSEHEQVTFEPVGSKMSSSGDLYFGYGNYSEKHGSTVEHGIYVLIWRANLNGDWKLVLDLQKKLPAPKQ